MRIGVDIRPAAERERRGIGHYTVQVMSAMLKEHRCEQLWRFLCLGADPEAIPRSLLGDHVELHHRRVGKLTAHHLLARATHRWDDRVLGPLDAFFVPSPHLVAVSPRVPLILTVHDAFFSSALHLMDRRERLWHRFVAPERQLLQASRLLANSETTAARIRSLLPEVAERITVVRHGIKDVYRTSVSAEEVQTVRDRLDLPEQFVLFLGGIEPRKNVRRLISGFAAARAAGLECDLVLAGAISRDSRAELVGLPMDGVHMLGFVDEDDKLGLYVAATALALPSIDEGLGLPPLEALACGTPSLVSAIPIFKESMGEAALAVDPYDISAIADGLHAVCHDTGLRDSILSRREAVIGRYDWNRCAEETYQAIIACASSSQG